MSCLPQAPLKDLNRFKTRAPPPRQDSGFSGGNDEKVAVYDKPLFADRRLGLSGTADL